MMGEDDPRDLFDDRELAERLLALPKHRITEIQKTLSMVREVKFGRQRDPAYGNLSRALTPEQLVALLRFAHPRSRASFALMLLYGFREGEVHTASMVPNQGLVHVVNFKVRHRNEYIPLIEGSEILFLAPKPSYNLLRRDFRAAADLIGASYTYAVSRTGRKLYQFTTHSLRHSAISIVAAHSHDPAIAAAFARHSREKAFGTTGRYIHVPTDRVREAMEKALWPLVVRGLSTSAADGRDERDA